MHVLRTLYVADHSARLRIRKNNLVVERSGEGTRVPLEMLEAVILLGRADVTNDTIGTLTRKGIRLAALSKTGRIRFQVGGGTAGNVLLRVNQHEVYQDPSRSLPLARLVVAGKLQNCARSMQRWAWDARDTVTRSVIEREREILGTRISALQSANDGDTIRGIEGDGTRRYFKTMGVHLHGNEAALGFQMRSRRPPRDPTNSLLSFLYGLVLTEVVGGLESVGLDPQIGFLHGLRPGRPSLALDLLEEFRPSVADRFAVAAIKRRQIGPDDFERGTGRAVYLSDEGRQKVVKMFEQFRQTEVMHPLLGRAVPVALLPSIQATLMARHLRGDLPAYPSYTLAA